MPKFGLMINPSVNLLEHMKLIYKNGFDFAELTIEPPNATVEKIKKQISAIKRQSRSFSHPLVGHTAWWLDLGSEYESIRKASVFEFKKAVNVCKSLEIEYMNVHATTYGMYFGKSKKIILDNFAASLNELKAYAKKRNVKIMLENVPEKRELSQFESYKYLIDRSGAFVHLDIAHAFVVGGMGGIQKYIRTFKRDIRHIHIHDNMGLRDDHLAIGKGKIDFEAVVQELKKINYNGTMTFEVFRSMKDAVKSREKIRKMWEK
jgi:sugar phosphate isomerase/epimerase